MHAEQLADVIRAFLSGLPEPNRDRVFGDAARSVDEWLRPELEENILDFDPFEVSDETLAQLI
jgi:hypothetical protein